VSYNGLRTFIRLLLFTKIEFFLVLEKKKTSKQIYKELCFVIKEMKEVNFGSLNII